MQGMWFFGGVCVGMLFGYKLALIVWGIYTFGYINGHIHWGTKWIKGQKGNGQEETKDFKATQAGKAKAEEST